MTSIGGHLAHQMQTDNCNSDLVQHSFIMNHHHHTEDIHPILTTNISEYQLNLAIGSETMTLKNLKNFQ